MSGEKTEQPTHKRLQDARKKGQVSQSRDVSSTALLIAFFAYLGIYWPTFLANLKELILYPTIFYEVPFSEAFNAVYSKTTDTIIRWTLPMLIIIIIVGAMASYFQVGALFAFESLKPDMKKLNPAEGIKKIFSVRSFVEFLKNILKVTFLSILLYNVIKKALPVLILMPFSRNKLSILAILMDMMYQIAMNTAFAYIVFAAADYYFQRKQHNKTLMMTKQEVKQEYKEMEGNPEIKGQRKQLHREMVMSDTVQKTRRSTAVVSNPTHLAIAILYNRETTKLPIVTAKGEGFLAKRMIEIAHEEGIPVMQNIPLAHALHDEVPLDHYIPPHLFEAVAEVLRWVQQTKEENDSLDDED